MNKRGIAKLSISVLVLVSIIFATFLSSSSTSFSDINTKNYNLGDSVKFDFTGKEYYLKITTPTTSFVRESRDDKFSFKLNEKGKYSFSITSDGKNEKYNVFVGVDSLIENQTAESTQNDLTIFDSQQIVNYTVSDSALKNKYVNKKEVKIYPKDKLTFGTSSVFQTEYSTPIDSEGIQKQEIRVLWKERNQYVDFSTSQNEFGFVENVTWNVIDSEIQTYQIIIVITNAEHLDYNKTFISDIYNQVKEQDGIWSENINENEYVRVKFEKKLNNKNDITIFPRIVSGNPMVEVYELEGDVKIAEFNNIVYNEYNKVYLTNLLSEQDIFDLKVVGGVLEFDHIIDPTNAQTIVLNYSSNGTFTVPAGVTSVTVEAWGGGGTGGSTPTNSNVGAGGGAGGQYARGTVTVTPGATYNFTVAQSRTHSGTANTNGLPGYNTSFYNASETFVMAVGGAGGLSSGNGALGGTGSTSGGLGNVIVYRGGNGGNGASASGAGGGGAGSNGNGGDAITTTAGIGTPELGGNGSAGSTTNGAGTAGGNYSAGGEGARRNAVGGAGARGYLRITYTTPDTLGPLITINSPLNTTYNYNYPTIDFNVTLDESGSSCFYSLNNGATNYSMSANSSNTGFSGSNSSMADGSYTVIFYCYDSPGNMNRTNITFFRDKTLPLIQFGEKTEQNNSFKSSSIILVNVTYSDSFISNATIFVYNSTHDLVRNSTSTVSPNISTFSGLTDGIYYFNATAYDTLSNSNSTETWKVTLDTLKPSLFFSYPLNTTYNYPVLNLNYTFIEQHKEYCWYSTNNGLSNSSFLECGNNFTDFIGVEGTNIVFLYMNDSAGNQNSTNITFFQDSTYPKIRFVAPTASNASSRSETFIYAEVELIEDNFANITYTLANTTEVLNVTTFNTPTTSITWYNLNHSNVRYFYNVSTYDILGNYNYTETRVLNLTLGDFSPPDIFFNIPLFNGMYFNYSNIDLNVTLSENASSLYYSFDYGQTNYSMSNLTFLDYNATVSLSNGFYELTVFVNDTLGNAGKRSRNFTVDTVYPLIDYGFGNMDSGSYVSYDWIYANVSVVELNEYFINFSLYNDLGLVSSVSFEDLTRNYNWTGLSQGVYYYNITLTDLAGNSNYTSTRNITIDLTNPSAVLNLPENNSYFDSVQQNLSVNISDNYLLGNLTLFIYNSSNDLINQTLAPYLLSDGTFGIVYNFPYSGNFTWRYQIFDYASNTNITELSNILIDTINPQIDFSGYTEQTGSDFERDWIYANVSILENNFVNLTYYLYNSTDLVNSTTFYSPFNDINWTELTNINTTYYYNVSVYDLVGRVNYTETRTIKLTDVTKPAVTIISPQNISYDYILSLPLEYSISDDHLDSCWYNLDNSPNVFVNCYTSTSFDSTEGQHVLHLYANDSLNNIGYTNVTFVTNESLILTPNYFVQRGAVAVSSFASSSLSTKTDRTKSFILLNSRSTSSTPNILHVVANYSNSSGINFYNYAGTATVEWESISGPGLHVQRGTTPVTTTDATLNINISQVNLTSSFIIIQSRLSSGTANQYLRGLWSGVFLNSTTIQLQRATTGTVGEVAWQVVDWDGAMVRNGSVSITGSNSLQYIGTNISTDRSFVIASSRASGSTSANALFGNARILNATTVQLSRGGGAGGTLVMSWFVVSHDGIRVSNTSALFGATSSSNVEVSRMVNTSESFRVTSSNTTGAVTTYTNTHVTSAITNRTNVRIDKGATAQTQVVAIQTIEFIERNSPQVYLTYPENNTNFSTLTVGSFNFTVSDNSSIDNCSLLGSWVNNFGINQTITSVEKNMDTNFTSLVFNLSGYYVWNVQCADVYGNLGRNASNFTFAAFLPALAPYVGNITQSSNNGTGSITLTWEPAQHVAMYNIYYSTNTSNFVLLNQTNSTTLNYTDTSFAGNKRRFYYVSAWNPTYENISLDIFAAQVYTLSNTPTNTRNWIGFIASPSFINASDALREIRNISAVTMWNATIQRAVTCNEFSCPNSPACTETNCNFNFNISQGSGYEVNLNSTIPINWSLAGKVYTPQNITLVKNSTSFGKNWISIYPSSKFTTAQTILGNVSRADAVTRWNPQTQASQGLIPSPLPFGPRYIGTNFTLSYEEGYEISVNQTINMSYI